MAISEVPGFLFHSEEASPVHLASGNYSNVVLPYHLDSGKLNFDSDENINTHVNIHNPLEGEESFKNVDGGVDFNYDASMLDSNKFMIDSMDNTKLDDESFKVGTVSYFKPVTDSEVANYKYKNEEGQDAIFRKIRLSNSSTSDHYDAKFSKLLSSFTTYYQLNNHFDKIVIDQQSFSTVTTGFSLKVCERTKDIDVFDSLDAYVKSFESLSCYDRLLMPKYSNLDFSKVSPDISLDEGKLTTRERNYGNFASSMLMSPLVGTIVAVEGFVYVGDDAIRKAVMLKWIREFAQKFVVNDSHHLIIIPFSGDNSNQLSFKHVRLNENDISLPKIFEDENKVPVFLNDIFKDDVVITKVICLVIRRNVQSETTIIDNLCAKMADRFSNILKFPDDLGHDSDKCKLLQHMFISKW